MYSNKVLFNNNSIDSQEDICMDVDKEFIDQTTTTVIKNEKLEEIYQKYNVADWDGNGAKPIGQISKDSANFFLQKMSNKLIFPHISPLVNGCISFEWHQKKSICAVFFDNDKSFVYSLENDFNEASYGEKKVTEQNFLLLINEIKNIYND